MNLMHCLSVLSILCTFFVNAASLPLPYNEIEIMPFNPQGWYKNGPSLEWLIRRGNVKTVIEIGCWLGLSTRHIAKTLPEDGIVYAVDHWMGSPNEDNSSFDMANLYRQFLSNIIHENLTHKIIPLKMSSIEAAMLFSSAKEAWIRNVKPDLIYIDATHDFNSVIQDLVLWFPFIKGHGILCGDDYFWDYDASKQGGPVMRAVDVFARENNLTVHHDGWMWYLEEK